MKYLLLALTLISSMSGSVNAATKKEAIWILMLSQIGLVDTPHGVYTTVSQTQFNGDYQTVKLNASKCYEDLKKEALKMNKNSSLFRGESRFRIEIVDDVIITAKARWMNVRFELHCLQISLN